MDNSNSGIGPDKTFSDAASCGSPAPKLDPADYLEELDGLDYCEAQKRELLETLWSIMGSFARMGFSVDLCGLIFEGFNEASAPRPARDILTDSTDKETPLSDAAREALHD